MKRTNKNYKVKRRRLHGLILGKGIAITTMAAVSLAGLPGCDINESGGSQIVVDPTSSFVVIDGQTVTPTPAITDGKEKQTVSPTPTGTVNSKPSTQTGSTTANNTTNNGSGINATPTTKPTNSTTTTSAASPTPKPSGQGSGSATATPNPTNNTTNNTTVEPTSTPSSEQTSSGGESSSGSESSGGGTSHTADPYSESCDCPYCSGDVSYRSARTIHHDAETHDETTSSYDGIVRTFRYTIVWSDNFKNWCSENGVTLPEAPSKEGSIIYDSDWSVLDTSGEDDALDDIIDEAAYIVQSVGAAGIAFGGYTTDIIGDEYLNYTETTTTIIDEPAWDENIPAGWYCDDCDYYSASVPRAYDDIDI